MDGYGKSHAAYPRILARAKSLKQENLVKKLELLTQATDEMIKIAQGKWNSPDKDNPERLQNFTTVRNKAVDYAVAIYEILVVEIANL